MRELLLLLTLICPLATFAGIETLSDGKTSVYWDNQTSTITYNSYRVDIKLTDTYEKNVWGSVDLFYDGKGAGSKSFMIKAGEKRADVDFDNLKNNIRYEIKVTIKGK